MISDWAGNSIVKKHQNSMEKKVSFFFLIPVKAKDTLQGDCWSPKSCHFHQMPVGPCVLSVLFLWPWLPVMWHWVCLVIPMLCADLTHSVFVIHGIFASCWGYLRALHLMEALEFWISLCSVGSFRGIQLILCCVTLLHRTGCVKMQS